MGRPGVKHNQSLAPVRGSAKYLDPCTTSPVSHGEQCIVNDGASILTWNLVRYVANHFGKKSMLHYAIVFLIIAIIAAVFGFTGIAGTSAWIAHVLFVLFLILFIISLIFRGRPSV